jgi:hypothetical protein
MVNKVENDNLFLNQNKRTKNEMSFWVLSMQVNFALTIFFSLEQLTIYWSTGILFISLVSIRATPRD